MEEVFTMKSTGIVRQLDSLGRIVLPVELRRTLNIGTKDQLEILIDGNSVVLRKYAPNCQFCGSRTGLSTFRDKLVCKRCVAELKEL